MNKYLVKVASLGVLLLCLATFTGWNAVSALQSYDKNNSQVQHTQEVIILLGKLDSNLAERQRDFRGYVATKDTSFLEDYETTKVAGLARIQELVELVSDNPNQTESVKNLQVEFYNGVQRGNELVARIKQGHPEEAETVIKQRLGQKMVNSVRNILERMRHQETTLLAERQKNAASTYTSTVNALMFSFVLKVILIALGVYFIRKETNFRASVEKELRDNAVALEKSNTELEQFAYVASHDLQEPLRMISSYCGLLEKRYNNLFDQDGKDFMGYIVEGAGRMKILIQDLLQYSRAGRLQSEYEELDLNVLVQTVKQDLQLVIEENNAKVVVGNLPTVKASESALSQVFTNLINNAIKFRKETGECQVQITATKVGDVTSFVVVDNGIGITAEYKDKIFIVFQRLHSANKYKGTGIGLAVCKKIIESHGGNIWLDTSYKDGAKFCFTIKDQ